MIRPRAAMVLAAGRGVRLRPITDTIPKPLIEIRGRALLDHALDRLELAGIEHAVVNTHYLPHLIASHLARRQSPRITILHEADQPLETGGAIVNALHVLGSEPFYVVNGDSLWLDGRTSALTRLARLWDPDRHDAILLLQRTATAVGYDDCHGDFSLDQLGRPAWRRETEIVPYLYAGVQLIAPTLFQDRKPEPFSVVRVWREVLAAGRLGAVVHDGEWYHVSTPEGLALVRERLETRRGGR